MCFEQDEGKNQRNLEKSRKRIGENGIDNDMIELEDWEKKALEGVRFIDLFAGIGAFRMALESFGAECVFSSEWDADAQKTYERNYGEHPAGDITKIDEKEIPPHEVLCAGFPCQPFSISGKKLGFQDTRGTLFFDVARIVKERLPKLVLLENVKNFAAHDGGRTLATVTSALDELGYDVYYDILNAADYGVPQKRERIFFVCFRKDLHVGGFSFPAPLKLEKHLCDFLLPDEETDEYVVERDDVLMIEGAVEHYSNTALRLGMVNKGGQGERIYSPMGTAVTLSAYGGGIGAKTGLYLVNGRIRRLAPRECARIDGFPDTFALPKSRNVAYKQLGNSIVVDVIQWIVRGILGIGSGF